MNQQIKIFENFEAIINKATLLEVQQGRHWYPSAQQACRELVAEIPLATAAGVVATLSPGLTWNRNLAEAETLIKAFLRGQRGTQLPLVGTYGWNNVFKAESILLSNQPRDYLNYKTGPKTRAFFENIVDPTNPIWVTIDRHARTAAYNIPNTEINAIVTPREYRELEKAYIQFANANHFVPCELQAIIWVTWKRILGERIWE